MHVYAFYVDKWKYNFLCVFNIFLIAYLRIQNEKTYYIMKYKESLWGVFGERNINRATKGNGVV